MSKRSNAPIFWLLFGAGGMLSALLGPVLVLITGVLVPLNLLLPRELMSYPRMLELAQHWMGKGLLLAVVSLFAWHAAHRILHSLHDLGIRGGVFTKLACYGMALAVTLGAAACLVAVGF
jgi:fumarate reductase subunit D